MYVGAVAALFDATKIVDDRYYVCVPLHVGSAAPVVSGAAQDVGAFRLVLEAHAFGAHLRLLPN